jgi:hypothetical protein
MSNRHDDVYDIDAAAAAMQIADAHVDPDRGVRGRSGGPAQGLASK